MLPAVWLMGGSTAGCTLLLFRSLSLGICGVLGLGEYSPPEVKVLAYPQYDGGLLVENLLQ